MKESDVYVFTDENQKTDENILSVDFYFESKCESFSGLVEPDQLVEKIKTKAGQFEEVLKKMNEVTKDLDNL